MTSLKVLKVKVIEERIEDLFRPDASRNQMFGAYYTEFCQVLKVLKHRISSAGVSAWV